MPEMWLDLHTRGIIWGEMCGRGLFTKQWSRGQRGRRTWEDLGSRIKGTLGQQDTREWRRRSLGYFSVFGFDSKIGNVGRQTPEIVGDG